MQIVNRHARAKRLRDAEDAERNEFTKPAAQRVAAKRVVGGRHRHLVQTCQAGFHRAERLLQAFLE